MYIYVSKNNESIYTKRQFKETDSFTTGQMISCSYFLQNAIILYWSMGGGATISVWKV